MSVTAAQLTEMIEAELATLKDERVLAHVRALLVPPYTIMRDWPYGEPGQQFPCWTVLEHEPSNSGVIYCSSGFGPDCPWGLAGLRGNGIGMIIRGDSTWFTRFLDAYLDSFAASELAIWRVFRNDGQRKPLTEEMSWDAAWAEVRRRQEVEPGQNYYAHHTIQHGSEAR